MNGTLKPSELAKRLPMPEIEGNKISQLEAEIKRLRGVIRGYEQVINYDMTGEEKVIFLNRFYKRGGSSCPENL